MLKLINSKYILKNNQIFIKMFNSTEKRQTTLLKRYSRIIRCHSLLIVLLLLTSTLTNPIFAQSEIVSIKSKTYTVEQVLKEIEKQTDYLFVFNKADIDLKRSVKLSQENKPVSDILNNLLKDTNISYALEGKNIMLMHKDSNSKQISVDKKQNKVITISGVVADTQGLSIIGASVLEKGTTNGAVTDIEGRFSLKVTEGSILEISCIGYKSIEVMASSNLKVVLHEDTQALEEVIVVGYGTTKKTNLTGSVSSVDGKKLDRRPVVDATQSLQGMVPGLFVNNKGSGRPGSTGTLSIRGQGNLSGTATPYVLVDGVEMDLSEVNPSDIENISVLKDASACAIYGARAAYGVILVTTKKGEEGKMKVNYQGTVGWNAPTVLPKMVDSYKFATYWNDGVTNAGSPRLYSEEKLKLLQDFINDPSSVDPWFELPKNSNMNPAFENSERGVGNTNYFDLHYKDWTLKQNHNLSFSGGGKLAQYYLSAGYYKEDGVLRYADMGYKRFNIASNVVSNITSWMKIKLNTKFMKSITDTPFGDGGLSEGFYHSLARFRPTVHYKDPNGHFTELTMIPYLQSGTYTTTDRYRLNLTPKFEINPLKNWFIYLECAYKFSSSEYEALNVAPLIYAADGVSTSKGVRSELNISPDGRFTRNNGKEEYKSINLYTDYSFNIADAHNFAVMFGYQEEDNSYKFVKNSITNLYSTTNPNLSMGSGDKVITDIRNGWATRGFFGRINYNYREKYLVEINGRYDGSSRFAKDNRWGFFPSVSLGWNLHKEPFMNFASGVLSNLKIRTSWGLLGNQAGAGLYTFASTMSLSRRLGNYIFEDGRHTYTLPPEVINPNTTWEKVESKNIGVDFGFFEGALSGTLDVFRRDTKDMLGPGLDFPDFFGASAPKTNNATMKDTGWELSINYRGHIGDDIFYSVGGSVYDAVSEVTDYANPTKTNPAGNWYTGKKVGEIWGYKSSGLIQSQAEADEYNKNYKLSYISGKPWTPGDVKYIDINGDGKIDKGNNSYDDMGDYTIIGNSTPRYQYTLNGSITWKGLSVSMLFQGVGKRDYTPGGAYFWGCGPYAQVTIFDEHLDYWREDNKGAYYPKPYIHTAGGQRPFNSKNQQSSDKYLQNASYCRLKNLTISYDIPKKIIEKVGISRTQVFFSGENLITFTPLKGMYDPEAIFTGNSYTGEGGKNYPMNKVISFGLILSL